MKQYTINVDILDKVVSNSDVKPIYNQGDINSAVLNINITQKESPYDLTGATVSVFFDKDDGTIVYQDSASGLTVTDAVNGKISVTLNTQTLAYPGKIIGAVKIVNGSTTIESKPFYVYVQKSLTNNSTIKSANYIDTLIGQPNEAEWTATAGQVTYVLPNNQTYDPNSKWLNVFVGGAPIPASQIQKDSQTQFTLLIDSSIVVDGMKVFATWVQSYVPTTSGHHSTHELGGYDEIDIVNLKNFNEQVVTPLSGKASNTDLGSLANLQTVDKSSLVNAVNENVGQLAQKATKIGGKVSLLDYYNSSDGSNYTNAFTNAFNYLTSVGGGIVQVPEGTYQALVNVPSHCGIEGVGEKSIIQSPTNATTHTVQNNGVFVSIKNLTIDGNMANQTNTTIWALYLYSSQTATPDTAYYNLNDSYFNVDNVKVLNGKAGGFQLNARGESFFNRVHALNNGGDGFYINAPDSMFTMCSSGQNFGHGFTILGSNNRLVNCKGWNNGQNNSGLTAGYGFYLNGCMNVYVQGEAQGNLLDGVYLNSAELCVVDVFNDANGQNGGINSSGVSGFTLNNCVYNTIRGNVRNRKDRSQTKINYVLSLVGSCSDNIIEAQGLDISIGALYDSGSNYQVNSMRIRGNDVSNNKFEYNTLQKTVAKDLSSATTWSALFALLPANTVTTLDVSKINSALLPNSGAYYGTITINNAGSGKASANMISYDSGLTYVMAYVGVWVNSSGSMSWKRVTVS